MIRQDQLAENCDKNNRMSFLCRVAAKRFHVGAAEAKRRGGGRASRLSDCQIDCCWATVGEEDATRGAMVIRQRQRREVSRQVDESGKGSPKTRIPANYIKINFSIGFKAHEVTRAISEVK